MKKEHATFLGLRGDALAVALAVKARWPFVVFTSGHRSLEEQANAMAGNVLRSRGWIHVTYLPSKVRDACHEWVLKARHVRTRADLAFGLLMILRQHTPEEVSRLTLHVTGDAFDIDPNAPADCVEFLRAEARRLDGKFLEREGGIKILHWQAKRRIVAPAAPLV